MEVTALFLFIGGLLGFRFKFPILIPAIILAVIVTGSMEIAQRQDVWSSRLSTLAAVIALQIGYVSSIPASIVANHAPTTTLSIRLQLGFNRDAENAENLTLASSSHQPHDVAGGVSF